LRGATVHGTCQPGPRSLNDCTARSRSRAGLRSPSRAKSRIRRATMSTAGSLRSTNPRALRVSSNAATSEVMSSGENEPPCKSGRIGITPAPKRAAAPLRIMFRSGVPRFRVDSLPAVASIGVIEPSHGDFPGDKGTPAGRGVRPLCCRSCADRRSSRTAGRCSRRARETPFVFEIT
jgi:hypothetical protein